MWYRIIPASLVLALLAGLVLVASSLADQPERRRDKDTAAAGEYYQGKIETVDADKRALVLQKAQLFRGKTSAARKGKPVKSISFTLTRDAKVTVDGKVTDIRSLKAGQWARVHVASARARLGSGDARIFTIADRRDAKTTPVKTDRVEVSTRGFLEEK